MSSNNALTPVLIGANTLMIHASHSSHNQNTPQHTDGRRFTEGIKSGTQTNERPLHSGAVLEAISPKTSGVILVDSTIAKHDISNLLENYFLLLPHVFIPN